MLQTASTNIPRFQYDPETAGFDGLLIEAAATNICLYSEQFDNVNWTKTNSSIATNSTTVPDGNTTAATLIENATTNQHYVQQTRTVTTSTDYVFSVFVKTSSRSHVQLLLSQSTAPFTQSSLTFDLTAGEVFSGTGVGGIKPVGNGWYRIYLTRNTSSTDELLRIALHNGTTDNYLGDGSSGLYLWGAQYELGTEPSSYIVTTGTSATRSADTITGTGLIYTDLTNDYSDWNSGTTYSTGQTVSYNKRYYESLQDTNLNNQPDTSTSYWLDIAPDNRHATLDNTVSTVSTKLEEFTIVLKPGVVFDSYALINASATIFSVAVSDPTVGLIYSRSFGISGEDVYDWYQYFFYSLLEERTQIVDSGISPYANAVITIRGKSSTGEYPSLGYIAVGELNELGDTQWGVRSGIVDYSVKETDSFGNTLFVERPYSKRMSANVLVRNTDLNRVQRLLYQLRATPSVWIASDSPDFEEALIIFGFYRDFGTTIAYPQHSLCDLEIEGLT